MSPIAEDRERSSAILDLGHCYQRPWIHSCKKAQLAPPPRRLPLLDCSYHGWKGINYLDLTASGGIIRSACRCGGTGHSVYRADRRSASATLLKALSMHPIGGGRGGRGHLDGACHRGDLDPLTGTAIFHPVRDWSFHQCSARAPDAPCVPRHMCREERTVDSRLVRFP